MLGAMLKYSSIFALALIAFQVAGCAPEARQAQSFNRPPPPALPASDVAPVNGYVPSDVYRPEYGFRRPPYPVKAVKAKASGVVKFDCLVTVEGYLTDCQIQSEIPPDMGFGESVLKLTARTRGRPAMKDGQPIEERKPFTVNFIYAVP